VEVLPLLEECPLNVSENVGKTLVRGVRVTGLLSLLFSETAEGVEDEIPFSLMLEAGVVAVTVDTTIDADEEEVVVVVVVEFGD
jgi:hypothetical protein